MIGVTEEEQIKYIIKLIVYHFKQAQWNEKFNETNCPEITTTKPTDQNLCGELSQVCLLPPEPALTICDYNKNFPGCNVDGETQPDCTENPRLCQPPRFCDLEENLLSDEC